jgi:hypothetical protein
MAKAASRAGKESASFLKKRSKKLSFTGGLVAGDGKARRTGSFLLLFFKKEALSLAVLPRGQRGDIGRTSLS